MLPRHATHAILLKDEHAYLAHAHLARALEWIERAEPERAVLTNLHNDFDYLRLSAEIPAGVTPAFDGLALDFGP